MKTYLILLLISLELVLTVADDCKSNKYRNIFKNAECVSESSDGKTRLNCTKGIEKQWMYKMREPVVSLSLLNWPSECFPPNKILYRFPLLENFTLENSTIRHFTEPFPAKFGLHLKRININKLENLELDNLTLFSSLPVLEILDLRNNSLEIIHPELISSIKSLKQVYLLDNKWNCSNDFLHWMGHLNTTSSIVAKSKIADFGNLLCRGVFYPGKPLHVVMDILKLLYEECPKNCSCRLANLVRDPEGILVPVTEVDCRFKKLKILPPNLPKITTILRLEGNQITEIKDLAQNPSYRKVADVYLDDNEVNSIKCLEGSDWLLNFRVLSLKRNNITKLPTHAFNYAFNRNQNIAHVYLSENPWKCNCYFTPRFQELLLRYRTIISDIQQIKCAVNENLDISQAEVRLRLVLKYRIISLTRSTICRKSEPTLHPLDVLNIILALLIIFVFVKFAYDYYFFKKSGQLPWIITKLP